MLVTISTETGRASAVSGLALGPQLDGLAYDSETGKMYAAGRFGGGGFYELDSETGEIIQVIATSGLKGLRNLADRPNTDLLYGIRGGSGDRLGTIDPIAGWFTTVATVGDSFTITGIAMVKLHTE